MKNIIKIILIALCIQSCNSQKEKTMNVMEDQYALLNKKVSSCYKKPDNELFKQKILEIFNTDISIKKEKEIKLSIDKYPETVLKEYNFIVPFNLHPMIPDNEGLQKMDEKAIEKMYDYITKNICNYNNMIFYNDIHATNWIKKNSLSLIHLAQEYGYTKNKDWLQFAFSKSKLYDPNELESFLFGFRCDSIYKTDGGDECKGQWQLRRDMLDKMIEYDAELSQLHIVANMVSNGKPESYEEDTEELYAYLMAHCYKAGQTGLIEYLYDTNPKMKEVFRKQNYYNIEGLEEYTNEFYIPQNKRFGLSSIDSDPYEDYGEINDPDGYTNLRDGKGTNHPVIKKIVEGEVFAIKRKEKEWCLVVSEDGISGWIHSSRVKIIEGFSYEMNYHKN
ncbi:SH3 domain-containing protein [Aquimarina longa]|uniref:SH3 domain-containing protein n=1 Tax=Aquimarina longa TaxID=1080221 RepID=UPI00078306DC|nr:SH3 domain-containing protein [Aquimarina longa]